MIRTVSQNIHLPAAAAGNPKPKALLAYQAVGQPTAQLEPEDRFELARTRHPQPHFSAGWGRNKLEEMDFALQRRWDKWFDFRNKIDYEKEIQKTIEQVARKLVDGIDPEDPAQGNKFRARATDHRTQLNEFLEFFNTLLPENVRDILKISFATPPPNIDEAKLVQALGQHGPIMQKTTGRDPDSHKFALARAAYGAQKAQLAVTILRLLPFPHNTFNISGRGIDPHVGRPLPGIDIGSRIFALTVYVPELLKEAAATLYHNHPDSLKVIDEATGAIPTLDDAYGTFENSLLTKFTKISPGLVREFGAEVIKAFDYNIKSQSRYLLEYFITRLDNEAKAYELTGNTLKKLMPDFPQIPTVYDYRASVLRYAKSILEEDFELTQMDAVDLAFLRIDNPERLDTPLVYTKEPLGWKKLIGFDDGPLSFKQVMQHNYIDHYKPGTTTEYLTEIGGNQRIAGTLLIGPPGTGKTWAVRSFVEELELQSGKQVHLTILDTKGLSSLAYEAPKQMDEKFLDAVKEALQSDKIPIIYIDEIDNILSNRENPTTAEHSKQMLAVFLKRLDNLGLTGVILLASTNREDLVDKAILREGRFDLKSYVMYPNFEERKRQFQFWLLHKLMMNETEVLNKGFFDRLEAGETNIPVTLAPRPIGERLARDEKELDKLARDTQYITSSAIPAALAQASNALTAALRSGKRRVDPAYRRGMTDVASYLTVKDIVDYNPNILAEIRNNIKHIQADDDTLTLQDKFFKDDPTTAFEIFKPQLSFGDKMRLALPWKTKPYEVDKNGKVRI